VGFPHDRHRPVAAGRRNERQVQAQQRAHAAAQRQHEQQQRAFQRAAGRGQRDAYLAYQQAREREADLQTQDLQRHALTLGSVLRWGLSARPFTIDQLRPHVVIPPFTAGALAVPVPMPDPARYQVKAPGGMRALSPSARRHHEDEVAAARSQFEYDRQAAQAAENERQRRSADFHQRYLAWVADQQRKAAEQDAQVDDLRRRLTVGDLRLPTSTSPRSCTPPPAGPTGSHAGWQPRGTHRPANSW
jgi:restriction system protein